MYAYRRSLECPATSISIQKVDENGDGENSENEDEDSTHQSSRFTNNLTPRPTPSKNIILA
jgi:hypothetical protein